MNCHFYRGLDQMKGTRKSPRRYFSGLSKGATRRRHSEIAKFGSMGSRNRRAYVGFQTDKGRKTRRSKYTQRWTRAFPKAKSLEERAAASGVPVRFLRQCYNRGMAAWRTGHRPGATQQQWGYARVSSLLTCGKTYHTTDADIVKAAKSASASAAKWFSKC